MIVSGGPFPEGSSPPGAHRCSQKGGIFCLWTVGTPAALGVVVCNFRGRFKDIFLTLLPNQEIVRNLGEKNNNSPERLLLPSINEELEYE